MNQLGPNASATIGTYNDVKGSQTNYTTIYAGSSQEQGKYNMPRGFCEIY